MGVEVVGFEMVQGPVESGINGDKENGKLDHQGPRSHEPIKFGSHEEEPVKEVENGVSAEANFPKDAADEWPAQKQTHYFYLIRYRPYDDPKIKSKLDQASIETEKKTQGRFKITEQLKAKRSERQELISQIKALNSDNRQFRTIVDEKIKEIEPLQQALGKLRNSNSANRGICSSEEELNNIIHSLKYRIQHESIPLSEEKQILRDIKQLEGTRAQVVANDAMRAKIQDSLVQKEALQDQVKLIGGDLDGVRKEQQVVRAKIKQLDDGVKAIDKEILSLQEELAAITEKRDKARESIHQLRKLRDDGNSYFYQSRTILSKAKELAARKDVKGLEDLSNSEVEKFMSLWNSNKSFRDDYEKRILASLDSRQLSRDGRIRNPGEKPLVAPEEPAPAQTEPLAKPLPKRAKEEPKPAQAVEALPAHKAQKETKSKSTNPKPDAAEKETDEPEQIPIEAPKKKEKEVDAAKLKEIKREEEIAKAKLAMERKKKLAEKAAAKAAIRAQKEAEKKNKEREKKLKKKAGATLPEADEAEEAVAEPEPEKESESVEAPAPAKEKWHNKETTSVRSRGRTRGGDSIPKAILKRKKATNYWLWAAPAAALLALIFAALGYHFLL